jgi:hypothetical protein
MKKKRTQPQPQPRPRKPGKPTRVHGPRQQQAKPPARKPALPAARPSGLLPRERGRPANNTTCDIYFNPNVPPAAPDVAGQACALVARFQQGSAASEGDQTFRWTHLLYLDADVDVRDSYPSAPVNRVYVPDKTGTGFDVVFVELVNRGTPARYKRVFLDRRSVTWPSSEL